MQLSQRKKYLNHANGMFTGRNASKIDHNTMHAKDELTRFLRVEIPLLARKGFPLIELTMSYLNTQEIP